MGTGYNYCHFRDHAEGRLERPDEMLGARVREHLQIRLFEPKDQDAVRQLVLTGLGEHFGFIDESLNPDLDDIAGHYLASGALVLVAELEGGMVGTGTLIEEQAKVGRLVRMSVAADRRGLGIGKDILAELLRSAANRGYERVVIETNDDWVDTIAFYRSCGFSPTHFANGDIHMAIELRSASGIDWMIL